MADTPIERMIVTTAGRPSGIAATANAIAAMKVSQQASLKNCKGVGGAWSAAVYGVAQSRTQLKRLSSSSIMLQFIDKLTYEIRVRFPCCYFCFIVSICCGLNHVLPKLIC